MKAKLMAGETVSDMYVDIEDDSSTYYRISKNEGRDDYRLLMQANGETKYYNIDINGDETTHMIRGTVKIRNMLSQSLRVQTVMQQPSQLPLKQIKKKFNC